MTSGSVTPTYSMFELIDTFSFISLDFNPKRTFNCNTFCSSEKDCDFILEVYNFTVVYMLFEELKARRLETSQLIDVFK